VKRFAQKSAAPNDLVNACVGPDRKSFLWTAVHQLQFKNLKRALSTAPVIATLDPIQEFILRTDASDVALGAVLAQRQEWKGRIVERPLRLFSRKLHHVGIRYLTYDRELLAIYDALEHWSCYVYGKLRMTIYTDHPALQHVLPQKKLSSRQWRYLDLLQLHDYEIKYFPGAAKVVADALSRPHHTEKDKSDTHKPQKPPNCVEIKDLELRISSAPS
jgi:hypothetical protein